MTPQGPTHNRAARRAQQRARRKPPRPLRRPQAVIVDPLTLLRPAAREQRDRVMARFLTALDAMVRGEHPGIDEWRDLSDAINTVETLCLHQHKLVPQEVMPTIDAAIKGMVEAAQRYKAGQGMRLSGEGLQALRDVLAIYEQCCEELTEHEMAQAQAETQRRVHALLRSKTKRPEVIEL
ncbi:hypothetical protein [Caldimonas sp.]|uniref:hypothetical protein n=1 Tax=Caldimonas sp. TaxID=2838790 RepID=UPI00307F37E2